MTLWFPDRVNNIAMMVDYLFQKQGHFLLGGNIWNCCGKIMFLEIEVKTDSKVIDTVDENSVYLVQRLGSCYMYVFFKVITGIFSKFLQIFSKVGGHKLFVGDLPGDGSCVWLRKRLGRRPSFHPTNGQLLPTLYIVSSC